MANNFHINPHKSKKLLLIFSATGTVDGKYHFFKIGRYAPCHTIFFREDENLWYQHGIKGMGESFEDTISEIEMYIEENEIEEVYTFGQSMGAYAAILYGCKLKAKVLAFGPETILKLPHSRSSTHMPKGAKIIFPSLIPIVENSDSKIQIYIGENDPIDVISAQKLDHLENVKTVSIRRVSHSVAAMMSKTTLFETVIKEFVNNKKIRNISYTGKALKIENFANAIYGSHAALKDKNYTEAIEKGREAVALYGSNDEAHLLLGKALLANDEIEQARLHFSTAAVMSSNRVMPNFLVANCCRRLKDFDQAIFIHIRNLKTWPDHAQSNYDLGLCMLAKKKKEKAIELIEKAIALDPKYPSFKTKLESIKNPPV